MPISPLDFKIIPPVIGHRGACAYAPENTLASFFKAKQLGVKWVELDIQMTADQELVVFHDDEISRTTNGHGRIQDHPLSYLKSLDAGSWFHPKFSGEKIPTLQEVIAFFQEQDLAVNIEIKAQSTDPKIMADKIVGMISENLKKKIFPFFISSFDTAILKQVKKANPALPIAHLADQWSDDWQEICDELDCIAFDLNYKTVTEEKVQEVLATNRLVLAYTVNDPAIAARLFSWGVSGVFSDCPDKIIAVLSS